MHCISGRNIAALACPWYNTAAGNDVASQSGFPHRRDRQDVDPFAAECPYAETDHIRLSPDDFYMQPGPFLGGWVPADRQPGENIELISEPGRPDRIRFEGRLWGAPQTLHPHWAIGTCDDSRRFKHACPIRPWPAHFHTSIAAPFDELVHVDFFATRSYGPLSGIEEYRVCVAGRQLRRGGHYVHVPAAFHRCFPLAVVLGHRLLLIRDFLTRATAFTHPTRCDAITAWEEIGDQD